MNKSHWIDANYKGKSGTIHFEDHSMALFITKHCHGTPLPEKKLVLGSLERTFYPVSFPDLARAYHHERHLLSLGIGWTRPVFI